MESSRKNDEVNYDYYKVGCRFNKTLPDCSGLKGLREHLTFRRPPKTAILREDFARTKTLCAESRQELAEEITIPT
jgi:hypothetical protein